MSELQYTPAQERAIHCIEKNVAVSAGAGSGKTRVLVACMLPEIPGLQGMLSLFG